MSNASAGLIQLRASRFLAQLGRSQAIREQLQSSSPSACSSQPLAPAYSMYFELDHIIAEAEELKARAKLHDAHSFIGFKLVATMARSIQQTPSPAAALHTAGQLSALLKEMKRGGPLRA